MSAPRVPRSGAPSGDAGARIRRVGAAAASSLRATPHPDEGARGRGDDHRHRGNRRRDGRAAHAGRPPLTRHPDPKDLRGAAAVARTLAYAAGLAGVVAGAILYQQGEVPFAVAIWVLTFAVGALLMIAAFLLQAMTAVLARLAHLEQDVRVLVARGGPDARGGDDPWP